MTELLTRDTKRSLHPEISGVFEARQLGIRTLYEALVGTIILALEEQGLDAYSYAENYNNLNGFAAAVYGQEEFRTTIILNVTGTDGKEEDRKLYLATQLGYVGIGSSSETASLDLNEAVRGVGMKEAVSEAEVRVRE